MEPAGKSTGPQAGMPPKLEQGAATERLQVVAPETWVRRVDDWRRQQPKIPSRSEAIRLLVDKALGTDAAAVERELRRRERQSG